jgi:type IV pilus assembly protein PilP
MSAVHWISGALLIAMLQACSSSEDEELQSWMQAQRQQARPAVQPIAEPKRFKPQGYVHEGGIEPFSTQKLVVAMRKDASQANSNAALIAPELNRRKEPLESVPLDSMVMVGSLDRRGQRVALIRAGALLYQIRAGQYLGQNYGRVTRISESEVTLREIVQDAVGEWIERPATLQLQERSR